MDMNMMTQIPTRMRKVFAFLPLIAASPLLAQEDCDNIVTIPELAAQIQEVQVDTVVLQSDGNAEVQLSNGNTYILVLGCTDPAYTEYNSAAIFEDCSCSTPVVEGCTDSDYIEYNASANTDDGSCITLIVEGCTDPTYDEYDASANTDDGSCAILVGCTESDAAGMDGYNYGVVQIGDQCWFAENLRTTTYADGTAIPEVTDNESWGSGFTGKRCDYDNDASNVETSGRLYRWHATTDAAGLCPTGWHVPTYGEWNQLTDYVVAQSPTITSVYGVGEALKSTTGWVESYEGQYTGTDDFGFSALPSGYREESGSFAGGPTRAHWWASDVSLYSFVILNTNYSYYATAHHAHGHAVRCLRDAEWIEIQGCTDPVYDEYDSSANIDDGSCATISGCTDPTYDEYDASANIDDGSCSTLSGCTDPAYLEYNPAANTDDGSCATISGCTDPVYDEYDSSANIDDGSCATISGCTDPAYEEYDASFNADDGSCATLLVPGCTDPAYTEYDCAANVDDSSCTTLVVEGCTDPVDVNYNAAANTDDGSCASYPCISIEFDGYTYSVVEIGDQCWFAENLRTTVYANGCPIPEVTDNGAWTALSTGARCDYGNNASNVDTYGRLYSWYAVDDARGLCPNGWHVPTDEEWTDLEVYISSQGFVGNEGASLRTTSGWTLLNGTDDFGFSALPGGQRLSSNAQFGDLGFVTIWWSSSINNNAIQSRNRVLHPGGPQIFRFSSYHQSGHSVRCLMDAD